LPPTIDSLFDTPEPPALGPRRRPSALSLAEAESRVAHACADRGLKGERAQCLRALFLLWHDHLDPAHALVQDLGGGDAAFVHGIIHRREPDYSNARYWFNRIGPHRALEPLAEAAAPLLAGRPALPYRLIRDGVWDPFVFIDVVSTAARQPEADPEARLLRDLQRQETLVLARLFAGA
jgi:hypothetical protein